MAGKGSTARLVAGGLVMLLLLGCGNSSDPRQAGVPMETYTAEQIFGRGEFELDRGKAEDAAFYFSEIERLYPYSDWTKRALIMQAFAFHQAKDYPNSRAAAQRFIDFYPLDDDAAYAQYLLALSYYDPIH